VIVHPAGITTAIQLKRSGHTPLLLEKDQIGGLLLNANLVENYPGFPNGITGEALAQLMVWHLDRVGVRVDPAEVRSLRRERDMFLLDDGYGLAGARAVVLASGTKGIIPDNLPLPDSLIGRYISCELKDIVSKAGSRVAVIWGGDCAFDYSLNLAGEGCHVSILQRGDRPRALPLLVDRVRRNPNIDYMSGVVVKEVEEIDHGVILHLNGGAENRLEVDFLLLAVGREPRDTILSSDIKRDLETGTGVEGLYLVGDVRRGFMRQVGIAVGDGLVAAMDIYRAWKGLP
jgi:thioredoxin reductase